ncbi:hypothetical protein ACUHMQ_06780 [Chitinimonas sp. PSY-7]|uniref:hypothetical protein n=1 Tax=Chitinimonas sp. PSY-7 TaxID=3459088 RepID=UPI00403FF15A
MRTLYDLACILNDISDDLAASNDHAALIQRAREQEKSAEALRQLIYGAGPFNYCLLNEGQQRAELATVNGHARSLRQKAGELFRSRLSPEVLSNANTLVPDYKPHLAGGRTYYGD